MNQRENDRLAAIQLLPLVLNGDEQALWGCIRLAQRYNDLELLVKACNNWRGFTLSEAMLNRPGHEERKETARACIKESMERWANRTDEQKAQMRWLTALVGESDEEEKEAREHWDSLRAESDNEDGDP